MKCPICGVTLVMSERNGVEIDYCPECRGIWLDRGELDKIIERASAEEKALSGDDNRQNQQGQYVQPGIASKYKKKNSMLSDILEIFGGE